MKSPVARQHSHAPGDFANADRIRSARIQSLYNLCMQLPARFNVARFNVTRFNVTRFSAGRFSVSAMARTFAGFFFAGCALFLAPSTLLDAQTQPAPATLTANPVFQNTCAKCHGKTAEGRFMAGPSLVSPSATSMSADDLRNIITNGKGRMPKYSAKLSSEEINTLVRQIKSSAKK